MERTKFNAFREGNLYAIPYRHHAEKATWRVQIVYQDKKKGTFRSHMLTMPIVGATAEEAAESGMQMYEKNRALAKQPRPEGECAC